MNEKQQKQLEKFKKFTRWMYEDPKESMFCARATFLVAMGIFNYIETLGAFMTGYFQKDKNGKIKRNKKGKARTKSSIRFNKFFRFLGKEYGDLLKRQPKVYDVLRCGLTHEYLPKRRFSIVGVNKRLTDEQMRNNIKNIDNSIVKCGVVLLNWQGKKIWQVVTPKLLIDFEDGVKKLIQQIENEQGRKLKENFFETANQINMEHFS